MHTYTKTVEIYLSTLNGYDLMEPLIFACMASSSTYLNLQVPLLAESIKKCGGDLSNCPLWIIIPESLDNIPEKTENVLESLHVKCILLDMSAHGKSFPFAGYVQAAAFAESLAYSNTAFLTWVGIDTLLLNPPVAFLLSDKKSVGYRPVHHTLVGSEIMYPPDPFWNLVYEKCRVSQDLLFPMHPHVDHNTIRPYFNAGHLVVRPERKICQIWWEYFKKMYDDPSFEGIYRENELYRLFLHQAVLTGVILSIVRRDELQELPFTYNYPLHLYNEAPPDLRPENINELVTVRYEAPEILTQFLFDEPVSSWLETWITP